MAASPSESGPGQSPIRSRIHTVQAAAADARKSRTVRYCTVRTAARATRQNDGRKQHEGLTTTETSAILYAEGSPRHGCAHPRRSHLKVFSRISIPPYPAQTPFHRWPVAGLFPRYHYFDSPHPQRLTRRYPLRLLLYLLPYTSSRILN